MIICTGNEESHGVFVPPKKSNRKAMNRNCSNRKANPALETITENK